MQIIIPNPTIENMSALAGLIAFSWSAFQEYRHNHKFGSIIKFKTEKKGLPCPSCGIQLSSKTAESNENFAKEVNNM